MLQDRFGRHIEYLRLSVTDRCDLRCTYCMPEGFHDFEEPEHWLTFDEIERLLSAFTRLGLRRVRLTGGEPLLRRDLPALAARIAALPGVEDLSLSTNATQLTKHAQALRHAGVSRLNVSLDSLRPERIAKIAGRDVLERIHAGLTAAQEAGFAPIKINMVVKRGVNDHTIVDMARRFKGSGHIVRFIEFMDVGATNGWRMDDVVPSAEVTRRIDAQMPLEPVEPNYYGEVAERWRYRDGSGEIGVVSSVTQAFCRTCTRARLSTDGALYTCLFATSGYDLRSLVRGGASDADIHAAIGRIWRVRGDRYSEIRTAETAKARKVEMSYIGG
jgi:cyclic pyranopterin phosphate synthase